MANAGGPEPNREPWLVYAGVFGGYYNADFQYGGASFANSLTGQSSQVLGDIATQPGALGGLQFGFQYHFQSPYSLGINLSAAVNAGKGLLTGQDVDEGNFPVDFNYQFRVNGNVDLTGVFGVDITPQTHLYVKAGASYGTLIQSFFTTYAQNFLNPIPVFQNIQHKTLWGWVVGLGLVHDISRWFSAFVEYDRYDYGNNNLTSLQNVAIIPSNSPVDNLEQHTRVTANALRLGFNVKFIGSYHPALHTIINNPWLLYLGGFAGYSTANYLYGATYFSNSLFLTPSASLLNRTAVTQGASGGGQLGFQYHFQNPYFLGMDVSMGIDADKARATDILFGAPDGLFPTLGFQARTAYNLGLAGVFGLDITPRTHLYAKLGAAYTRFIETLSGNNTENESPNQLFDLHRHHYFWGWLFGVGLSRDLNRWLSIFAEYNQFDYGNNDIAALDTLFGGGNNGIDHLTQHPRLTSSTVRLGLNLKFIGNSPLPAVRRIMAHPWLVYLGGFLGYYSATYQYGSVSFSNLPTSEITHFASFQRGVSGGGQLGFQYHFKAPYFVGFNASVASNANKAVVSPFYLSAPDFAVGTFEIGFRLNPNVDIAGVVGLDILPKTHLYAKIGASYAQLTATFLAFGLGFPVLSPLFSRLQRRNLWGWDVALGLVQDLNKRFNMFIEYNRYDYGRYALNTYDDLFSGGTNLYVQNVRAAAYNVRLGFNIKFAF